MHLGTRSRFFRRISRHTREIVVKHGGLCQPCAPVRLRQRDMPIGLSGVSLGQRQEVLLEPSVVRGRAGFRGERVQFLLSRLRCSGSALEARSVLRRRGWSTAGQLGVIHREFTQGRFRLRVELRSCLQCALMPVPRLRLGLPKKLCDIDRCRFASAAYRSASAVK